MLFTFATRACRWLLSFLELFNASIKDNTPFREGAIIRAYDNRVTYARAPRRVKGQYADAYYMRARPTGLMH